MATSKTRRPRTMSKLARPLTDVDDGPEQVIWQDTFSAKALINYWLALLTGTFGMAVCAVAYEFDNSAIAWTLAAAGIAWGVLLIYVLIQRLNVYYVLTNQRLIHRHGILTRHHRRIEVIDIDDVNYRQSILEWIVGVGTLELFSSDLTDPIIEMPGIDCVGEVAQVIDDARRAERVRRGIHVEAI